MPEVREIVIVQTAFLGDVILTLPLVQLTKRRFPSANIDIVVAPRGAGVLPNHPGLRDVIVYDKRGEDSGLSGLLRISGALRKRKYDLALVPHRSLRSSLLVTLARVPRRIGFTTWAGRIFLTDRVPFDRSIHEARRNCSLLGPLGVREEETIYPDLYPSEEDRGIVEGLLSELGVGPSAGMIGIAPGTLWNTKRWMKESFTDLAKKLEADGYTVLLIGGGEDKELCDDIARACASARICSVAGRLTLLQSAALIGKCVLLVSNDSAPMHLAVAARTPVVAIYGATVPEFGFAPYGKRDVVIETNGLSCRPCSAHGGDKCPITTFDCMKRIRVEEVYEKVVELAGREERSE